MARKAPVTRKKAKKILRHGSVRGHPLTDAQEGMFGAIAGGNFRGSKKKRKKRKRKKPRHRGY